MKLFFLSLFLLAPASHAAPLAGTYGLHLFFSEKEFVDELHLTQSGGVLSGTMHVPNDFDGPLKNLQQTGDELSFDLLVPKNSSRPEDLVFHYTAKFFDSTHEQMNGFVTLRGDHNFVASFVAFRRREP